MGWATVDNICFEFKHLHDVYNLQIFIVFAEFIFIIQTHKGTKHQINKWMKFLNWCPTVHRNNSSHQPFQKMSFPNPLSPTRMIIFPPHLISWSIRQLLMSLCRPRQSNTSSTTSLPSPISSPNIHYLPSSHFICWILLFDWVNWATLLYIYIYIYIEQYTRSLARMYKTQFVFI